VIWCADCEKATGTGYFAGKPEHDRYVKSPWNDHKPEACDEAEIEKARWMLFCPLCLDAAAEGTPEAGYTTKHPTVGRAANGDEIVRCSNCQKRYRFNLAWTFDKKEVPKPKSAKTVFSVTEFPGSDDMELYSTRAAAEERVEEIEDAALFEAGYTKIDEDLWESPFAGRLARDRAIAEAERDSDAVLPEQPWEVSVLG
jgi:hypothetical protein